MPTPDDDANLNKLGSLQSEFEAPADYQPGPLPAGLMGGPDFKLVGQPEEPKPLPALSAMNTYCLRGPCKHLLQTISPADVDTLGIEPIAVQRICKAVPGVLLEIDHPVYDCSDWDPRASDAASVAREARRQVYLRSAEGHTALEADIKRKNDRDAAQAVIDADYNARKKLADAQRERKQRNIDDGDFDPQP